MAKADKLLEQAQPHLNAGENVRAAVMGAYETKVMGNDTVRNGILIATESRIVFFSKKLGGYDLESFPFSNISSFEQSKSLMGHSVTFYATGNKVSVKWINTLPELAALTKLVKEEMSKKTAVIKPLLPEPTPATAANDVFDQLRQLGQLRDAGVITEVDFDTKKKELLSRL